MAAKLARWIVFSILFSLIPLGIDFISELARSNGEVHLAAFGRHGELYLLASAMCAVGLGEIVGVNQKATLTKIFAGGAAVLVIALATALYTISASDAVISLTHQNGTTFPANDNFAQSVLSYSSFIFIFACVVSTSCIALSEVK